MNLFFSGQPGDEEAVQCPRTEGPLSGVPLFYGTSTSTASHLYVGAVLGALWVYLTCPGVLAKVAVGRLRTTVNRDRGVFFNFDHNSLSLDHER